MKRISTLLLSVLCGILLLFALSSCGECEEHVYGEPMIDREATETSTGEQHRVCTKCGDVKIEEIPKLPHTHTYAETFSFDDTYHWFASTCGHEDAVSGKEEHMFVDGCCVVCGAEEPEPPHAHTYDNAWSFDDTYHWHASTCGHETEVSGKAEHTFGDWDTDIEATEDTTGQKSRTCTACGKEETAEIPKCSHKHLYSDTWSSDDTYHWHASICGHVTEISGKGTHTYESGVCTVCGAEESETPVPPHVHTYSDEWSENELYHWHASVCGHFTEVSEKAEHTYENGVCTICGGEEIPPAQGLWYSLAYSGTYYYYIVKGSGSFTGSRMRIPSVHNGLPVMSIYDAAFYGCTRLTRVIVPDTVTGIGRSAFAECENLESITLPFVGNVKDGKTDTGFGHIFGVSGNYIPAALKTVVITGSAGIANQAFEDCANLTSIRLPGTITTIGDSAFYGCTGLSSIRIPDTVKKIGWSAFYDCAGLTDIQIPCRVIEIQNSAFAGCTGLTSIVIPESVTYIGDGAFAGCTNLESLTLPFAIRIRRLFSDVIPTALKTVVITDGTTIPWQAFYNCKDLTGITLPDTITSIGEQAFEGCAGLESLTIPANVTSIGEYAFHGCAKLKKIVLPDAVTVIPDSAFSDCSGLAELPLSDAVTSIGDCAFAGCSGLTNVVISDTVTSIGRSAFARCTKLESITLPFIGNVKDGRNHTQFRYIFGTVPSALKTVVITGGTTIGNNAFADCASLTSISLPDTTTNIGDGAFSGCTSLTYNEYEGAYYLGNEKNPYIVLIKATRADITDCKIHKDTKAVYESAFQNCVNLTRIEVPEGVAFIGFKAFSGCTGLERITLPFVGKRTDGTSNTYFGYIFGATGGWENGKYVPSALKIVVITGGTSVDDSGFNGCNNLTKITLPATVTKIGGYAFRYCSSLKEIVLSESITSIGREAFSGCRSLERLSIPDSVTNIGTEAFKDCNKLEYTEINGAYYLGNNLNPDVVLMKIADKTATSFRFQTTTKCVYESAFAECTSLTEITISASVTYIGKQAFSRCNALTDIYYSGTETEWLAIEKADGWDADMGEYTVHCKNPA